MTVEWWVYTFAGIGLLTVLMAVFIVFLYIVYRNKGSKEKTPDQIDKG
jgi:uncharacterized membrane protein YukC